jgi:aryl-alcohol dehydrogenase-like predicted oxidoreductase
VILKTSFGVRIQEEPAGLAASGARAKASGWNSYFPLAGGLLTGKYPPPAYFGMERSLSGVRIPPSPPAGHSPVSAAVRLDPLTINE